MISKNTENFPPTMFVKLLAPDILPCKYKRKIEKKN